MKQNIKKYTRLTKTFSHRMPDTYDEKKVWIDIIEKSYNDTQFRGFGSVCNLHFSSSDIEIRNGKAKLKKGAVPTLNSLYENSILFDGDNNDNCEGVCNGCTNLNSKLEDEIQRNTRIRLNNEIELHGKIQKIEKLTQKCNDQSMQIGALKAKVAYLEKMKKEYVSKNSVLEQQLVQHYGAADVNVIIYWTF